MPEQSDPPLGACPAWCQKLAGHDWEDRWSNGLIRYHTFREKVGPRHAIGVDEIEQATSTGIVRQREVVLDVESPTSWDLAAAVKGLSALAFAVGIVNSGQTSEDGEVR